MRIKNIGYLLLVLAGFSRCQNTEESVPARILASDLLESRWDTVHAAIDSIRDGDLILRCGDDMTSFMLKDFSQQEKLFSHSGLAFRVGDSLFVYHNMAGDLNPDEVMRRDPIDSFLTPAHNVAFGIYRYTLDSSELNQLRTIVLDHYTNHLPFDMSFDLRTDDKMYCVEMIAKSLERATHNRIRFSTSLVDETLKRKYLKMALQKKVLPSRESANQREYLAIDNLYRNPDCKAVMIKIFEENNGPKLIPSEQ